MPDRSGQSGKKCGRPIVNNEHGIVAFGDSPCVKRLIIGFPIQPPEPVAAR